MTRQLASAIDHCSHYTPSTKVPREHAPVTVTGVDDGRERSRDENSVDLPAAARNDTGSAWARVGAGQYSSGGARGSEAVLAKRRFSYALIVAFAASAASDSAQSDTQLSPADNAKMEAAISRCAIEMQRELGPPSFPWRTIDDIENAITTPATNLEARKYLKFLASCIYDKFLRRYCEEHPAATQCELTRSR